MTLAYEAPRGGDDLTERIWVMHLDGSAKAEVTAALDGWFLAALAPTWSSDGRYLAFEALPAEVLETAHRLWVVDVTTGQGMPVTPLGVHVEDPDWAPDGSGLVYTCDLMAVCWIGATGGEPRPLSQAGWLRMPAMSPDGAHVAVSLQDGAGVFQLATMPLEGVSAGVTVLTSGAATVEHPSWVPVPGGGPEPPSPPQPPEQPAPYPDPARAQAFDGDPATTERIDLSPPTTAAIGVSLARFADGAARHVVLSRDDAFPDSLAGSALTGEGPLLLTRPTTLSPATQIEIGRVLPMGGTVYLLGGPTAISSGVEQAIRTLGYEPVRLQGPSRVETALAVADEVLRLHPGADVLLARAFGAAGNETSAWADSVTAGGLAAWAGAPILLTATDSLHPSVAAWLAGHAIHRTFLLGGTAALSTAVEVAVPGPVRTAGAERTETAALVAEQLWGLEPGASAGYVVIHGGIADGWAYGLAAAGLAADHDAPALMVLEQVPPAIVPMVGTCGLPAIDLLLVGDATVISAAVEAELDALDGGLC